MINVSKKKQRIPKGENASKGTTTPLESSTNRSDKVLNLKEIKTKQTLKTTTTATDRGCTTGKQTLQNVKPPPLKCHSVTFVRRTWISKSLFKAKQTVWKHVKINHNTISRSESKHVNTGAETLTQALVYNVNKWMSSSHETKVKSNHTHTVTLNTKKCFVLFFFVGHFVAQNSDENIVKSNLFCLKSRLANIINGNF